MDLAFQPDFPSLSGLWWWTREDFAPWLQPPVHSRDPFLLNVVQIPVLKPQEFQPDNMPQDLHKLLSAAIHFLLLPLVPKDGIGLEDDRK